MAVAGNPRIGSRHEAAAGLYASLRRLGFSFGWMEDGIRPPEAEPDFRSLVRRP